MPGMGFAALRLGPDLMSPRDEFDASRAGQMPGVEAIVPLPNGVAVVAQTTGHAEPAADVLDCSWEDAGCPADTVTHFEPFATAFDPRPGATPHDNGETAAARVERVDHASGYRAPDMAYAMMEPMNRTALHQQNSLHICVGTQAPTVAKQEAAKRRTCHNIT